MLPARVQDTIPPSFNPQNSKLYSIKYFLIQKKVSKVKCKADGVLDATKRGFGAKGFSQAKGMAYTETFTSIIKLLYNIYLQL